MLTFFSVCYKLGRLSGLFKQIQDKRTLAQAFHSILCTGTGSIYAQSLVQVAYKMHSWVLDVWLQWFLHALLSRLNSYCLMKFLKMGSTLRHKYRLFRIFKSGSLWKTTGKLKKHIQEHTKGNNLREGHMIRNRSICIDSYSTFFALSCTEDELMLGQRGFDTVLFLRK